eukprot:TRINITY_DN3604_c0_g1_i1.p1 TRINITY_DN3604_c0_g1~~TRINITY_DN3604_c0_g1_i1.p1  ORF type:complete len:107 (+),score=15.48 TRINITY_DN3604_c0_g1_i1:55-375(+)
MALAEKNGVSRDTFMEFTRGFFPAPVIDGYGTRMANNNFASGGGFTVTLGSKDVGHMQHLAKDSGVHLPLADIIQDHLKEAATAGRSDLDWGAIATVVRDKSGIKN